LDYLDLDRLPDEALIRLCTFKPCLPFSSATLWRKVKTGKFPAPIKISPGVTAWRVGSVREWFKDPSGYCANSEQKHNTAQETLSLRRGE